MNQSPRKGSGKGDESEGEGETSFFGFFGYRVVTLIDDRRYGVEQRGRGIAVTKANEERERESRGEPVRSETRRLEYSKKLGQRVYLHRGSG